ncbi:hypothetical protein GCWU000342_01851 [Shuttleworthella satelles DSM 14600]|uniref:Uncharacterized protein n=1 Tax=Shuttleworthella satelles DSM 14600 TaxID=626523 RepID=C4GD07_9FIRM|nr:hypothetical protein GCWU000342_01851 [Shuttleworthia satelles DSM 14600]
MLSILYETFMKSNEKNRISALPVFDSRRKRERLGEAALRRRYFTMGVVKNVKMYWGFYKTYPTSSWAMSLNKFANYITCFLSIIYNFKRNLPPPPPIDRSMSGVSPNMAEPPDTLPAESK